jgi:hypothetical protein
MISAVSSFIPPFNYRRWSFPVTVSQLQNLIGTDRGARLIAAFNRPSELIVAHLISAFKRPSVLIGARQIATSYGS